MNVAVRSHAARADAAALKAIAAELRGNGIIGMSHAAQACPPRLIAVVRRCPDGGLLASH